ncbi:MAG: hypothetical protein JXB85_18305 [Anaerolineales bacterium]|nr:hypothetical protein [Anaerolineales bacterium]
MAATSVSPKQGLLPTPPIPEDLPGVDLTENARQVLIRRYVRRGDDGQPVETPEEMFWRVAYHIAMAEEPWGGDVESRAREFYLLLTTKKFFPNSPTFTGAGTPLGQLAACFVLPIADDMGRDPAGIFQSLRDAALIQQTGGGNGFSFSRLRPKGAFVKSSAGQATGPVGFLRVYDHAFGEIAQGGCLLPETLVFTEQGLLRLDEIADRDTPGWQSHALQVATDQGWQESSRAYNNGVASIRRVITREGLSLAGTPEHKVKVMTDDGPAWRALCDLQSGDWILVQLGQHRGRLRALKRPPRAHGDPNRPNFPAILDEELAFFVGYLIGEGFVAAREEDHRLGVSVDQRSYLMKEMPAMLERLFGVQVRRQQKADDRPVTFLLDDRAVKEFLQMNGLVNSRTTSAQVPALIRRSPPEIVGAFLRGLLEAGGSVSQGCPDLRTNSPRLADEVATLLIGLGCPVRVRTIVPGSIDTGTKRVVHVRILSSVGLQAWRDRIGCDPRSRFAVCMARERAPGAESSYSLPNPHYWFGPVLEAIALEQMDRQGRGLGRKFRSEAPQLRRSLVRYRRGERRFTRSAFDELGQAYPAFAEHARSPEGMWFVQVLEVVQEQDAQTLDLEVEQNHTYLAYGMVTHNTRRGANMGVLRVDHPDIEEFISCKTNENAITNFNISVGITDAFMQAVQEDADWDLVFPDVAAPEYRGFSGTIEQARERGVPLKVYRTIRAREIFQKIVEQAHHNGEPGVLFLDAANRENPVPHLYPLESTNPCVTGETLLYTEEGLQRADHLAAKHQPIRVATDARFGQETFQQASHVFPTGRKAVYRLMTREGYELRLTENHQVMTVRGWVAAGELHPGDRIHLYNRKGGFGAVGSLAEGRLLGWLVADGTGTVVREVLSFLGDEESELAPAFAQRVNAMVETPAGRRSHSVGSIALEDRDEARVASNRLRMFAEEHGLAEDKFQVPSSVYTGSESMQRGFLQALFTADGQVNDGGEKGCSVRLGSSHLALLKDVQQLLLNFGIASRIFENRRPGGYRTMPDGRGGKQEIFHLPQHELAITRTHLIRFSDEVGFMTEAKQSKLAGYLDRMVGGLDEESYLATVLAVDPDGVEMVYDLHEPETHSFVANGLVVHNCGEQWLGPHENCCLGSVNLNEHCGPDGTVDWEALRQSVVLSTRFLDDVIDANAYVPAVPALKESAHRARRIGLGIMGLADLMYHAGVRYGSEQGQAFGARVMEFVRYHAMRTSVDLARERGAFPAIKGSIYDFEDMRWTPPQSIVPGDRDWGRPVLDWDGIVADIKKFGIRNAAQATVAPTGTIATVAGCEGYGCEPVFALAYIRHVNDKGKDLQLTYTSPRFKAALEAAGISGDARQEIVEQVMQHGTCQDVDAVPLALRQVFVVAGDITAEEHIRMQAALQAFVDNSLSKTINFPEGATVEDVAETYMLAWELGCKGTTVYVTGSRETVVLETRATADKKQADRPVAVPVTPVVMPFGSGQAESSARPVSAAVIASQIEAWNQSKKPRPALLRGSTFRVETPLGKAFVTVNENGGQQPFEVFINTSKAGSETAAVSEAIGRLISYILRLASPIPPRERMMEVVKQLSGIGGGRSLGFGPNRIRSLPDGVGRVLDEYLTGNTTHVVVDQAGDSDGNGNGHHDGPPTPEAVEPDLAISSPRQAALKMGDLCPECGEATMVNEEGCRKCYTCGYSEC